ncbi:MAG: T9SS type A sorting domain-containing protein [Bacteroidales bacterium]
MKNKFTFVKQLCFLLLFLSFSDIMAQQANDSTNNYFFLKNKYTEFYNGILSNYGADSLNNYGYKSYYRWKNYWFTRFGEGGDLQSIGDATRQYYETTKSSVNPNPWEIIGPEGLPADYNNSHCLSLGKGMIISLWVNPENHQEIFAGTHTAGLFYTNDKGENWNSLTDEYPEIQGVYKIVQHPTEDSTFYFLCANTLSNSSNGIFVTTNKGMTWDEFPIVLSGSTQSIYPIANPRYFPVKMIFNPDSVNVMILITQSSILKSVDGGTSWNEKYNGNFNWWGWSSETIEDSCGTDYQCIMRKRQQEHGFNNIFYDQTNSQNIYASGHILLKSSDYGNTWDSITESVTGKIRGWNIYTDVNDNYPGYAWIFNIDMNSSGNGADGGVIYKLNLASTVVTQITHVDGYNRSLFRVSPTDSSRFYLGGMAGNTLGLLSKYGTNSYKVGAINYGLHDDCRDLYPFKTVQNYDSLFIACDGGVSGAKENPNNWTYDITDLSALNSDWHKQLNISEFYAIDGNESQGKFIIGNCQDISGFYKDTIRWVHTEISDGGGILVDQDDPNYIYYVDYQGRLLRSENKGKDFSLISGIGAALDSNPRVPLALDPDNPNHLFLGTVGLWRFNNCRTDNSYDITTFPHDNGQVVTAIRFAESNTNVLYVGTQKKYNSWDGDIAIVDSLYTGCIWRSPDKGTTWVDISKNFGGAYDGFVTDICINPFNENELWVTVAGATTCSVNQFLTKKIYHSLDAGSSWETYVTGLPDKIPVMKMKYDKINHHLYIVTDIGVFTRDLLYGSSWEDYNDGLPKKMVNDIYLNMADKKIVAATYGRSIWKTDLKPAAECPEYSSTPIHINTNTVWDTPRRIYNDVIIDNGYTLTIKSVSFFNGQASLIVQPGAKLEIEGGVLTNSCDSENWPGIQVWGTSSGAQNPLVQGWVSMNNATIENASRGIVANNYYTPDAWKQGYSGGIIMARNSIFRNCNVSIQFDPYDTFSSSWFNKCLFIVNSDSPFTGTSASFDFVKIKNHKGTEFSICSFLNDATELFDMENRGKGILSTNGGFTVEDGCIFTDLYYGIYATDVVTQNTFTVKDAIFNTYRGAYLSACRNNVFRGNTFNVPVSVQGNNNNSYGLYLQNSTAYTIEDNYFLSNETSPTGIGLYINNSGTDNNEVYSNDFENLQYSIIAQDINRNGIVGGLYIKCNTFTNTASDINVSTRQPYWSSNYGIAKNQGANSTDPTLMAGNLFYYNTTSTDYDDLNNGLSHFNYYYPSNTLTGFGIVNPLDITFNSVTKVPKQVDPVWSYTNGCPSHTGGGGGGGSLRSQMLTSGQQADSTANVLTLLVDGGNTLQLAGEVQQSTPPQTVTMYNELMATSPYLSDSVVGSAIVKEDVLPNALLRDIMVANAHSAKSEVLMTNLDSRANPMPDYMKAQILQGRSLVSLKEETEARLGAYRLNEARALYGLSRQFMTDTLNPLASTDSLIGLLAGANTLNAQYQLALLHLNRGEYSLGSNVLSNVPANFSLSAEELTTHQNMVTYYNWLVAIKQNQGNILYPDMAQQQQLWNIAQADSSGAGVYARNLLVSLDETTYNEPIVLPDMYKSTQAMEDYDKLLNSALPRFMKVFPNPASEYVIFEYQLETDVKATVSIQDIHGITIESRNTTGLHDQITIITRKWKPGVYVASLKVNGRLVESAKFTILN